MNTKVRPYLLLSVGLIFLIAGCSQTPASDVLIVTEVVQQVVKETVIVQGTPQVVEKLITPTPAPVEKPTVVFAQGVDAIFLDPNIDPSTAQKNIHLQTHDTLYYYDKQLNLVPRLAESVEIPDPTTFIFKIKKGIKFHNGTELTAKDVKFSFEQCYLYPETMVKVNNCKWGEYLDEVNILDDYTVELKLAGADGVFMNRVTELFIVSEDAVRTMGADEHNNNPIGTGPFKFVEWIKDQRVVLEANEDYWDGPPSIGKLIIRPIPEASTAMAALRAGEIDVMVNVPPDAIESLQLDPNIKVHLNDADRLIFIYLNAFQPPFDNLLVRKAVNHAVDWDAIINFVLDGQGYRTPCPITPYDFPYEAVKDICEEKAYNYDPEKAKALLAEAGYPNGFTLDLEGPDGRYLKDKEVLLAIGGYLDEVGIKTTVKPQEWGIYYQERYYAQKVTAGLFGNGNPLYDFDHVLGVNFDTTRRSLYYNQPRLSELILMAINTPYPEERIEYYREAMNIIMDEAPWIFGYGMMDITGTTARIDWTPRLGFERILFREMNVKE